MPHIHSGLNSWVRKLSIRSGKLPANPSVLSSNNDHRENKRGIMPNTIHVIATETDWTGRARSSYEQATFYGDLGSSPPRAPEFSSIEEWLGRAELNTLEYTGPLNDDGSLNPALRPKAQWFVGASVAFGSRVPVIDQVRVCPTGISTAGQVAVPEVIGQLAPP